MTRIKEIIAKVKAFIKMITPWVKFGLEQYKQVTTAIKYERTARKQDKKK